MYGVSLSPYLIKYWTSHPGSLFHTLVHVSVLPFEMTVIEPGENPTRTLTWKPLGFLNHIKRRTNDDRFPLSLWEVWFCSSLRVPIPDLIGSPQRCACNVFDLYQVVWRLSADRDVKLNQRLHRFMIGWYTSWVSFLVRWVIELRSTTLRLQMVKNGVILR